MEKHMGWKDKDDGPRPGEENWVNGVGPALARVLARRGEPIESGNPVMNRALSRLGAGIEAREAAEAAKKAEEAAAKPAEPKRGVVVHFPLFPAACRPVPNDVARSALFSCVQGKDRAMVKDALIAAVDGIQIRFTGERFNQDDHDVLMQLVHMAAHQPLGEWVTVPAHALLKALGRKTGGKDHQQLRADLTRLRAGTVRLKNTRTKIEYIGGFVDEVVQDKERHYWKFKLNHTLQPLYSSTNYTLVDWKQRKNLHGKDLARWLQVNIATHAAPFPMKVATLRELSGSKTAELFKFRQGLRKALQDLTDNGDITAWTIDPETDLVTIDRGNGITDSQQRHLNKNRDTKHEDRGLKAGRHGMRGMEGGSAPTSNPVPRG
jgi:TrfA protein